MSVKEVLKKPNLAKPVTERPVLEKPVLDPESGFSAAILIKIPHKHHIFIGFGTIVVVLALSLFLAVTVKSRKASAEQPHSIEIASPAAANEQPQSWSSLIAAATPSADVILTPLVTISRDGLPVYSEGDNAFGLLKQPNVEMTAKLGKFSQELSKYFSNHKMQALITSAVRTSARQLDLIKERIAEHGMMDEFPGLESAGVSDTAKWIKAWEWLKEHHVPVNPPADYVNEHGDKVGGSLHLRGLALDLESDDLDALKSALETYQLSEDPKSKSGLHIIALVRERDCVHISLTD